MMCLQGTRSSFFLVVLLLASLQAHTAYGDENFDDDLDIAMDNDLPSIEDDGDDEGTPKPILETIQYETPNDIESIHRYLYEAFDDELRYMERWIKSKTTKAESEEMKFNGLWSLVKTHDKIVGDLGLQMQSAARHHAIGVKLEKPFVPKNEDKLVVQYEIQFTNGQECGGAYLKLLSSPSGDLTKLHDKTPYSIMFGPDKCGNDHKLHFIFNHKNPRNGSLREIHWKKAASVNKLEDVIKDKKWHLFRLEITSFNDFTIQIDKKTVGKGSLFEDFTPAVNPPKEIDDPKDKKPANWDEREKIPDPEASKPDDWDEDQPRKIPDPDATIPSDWDESEPENVADPEATKPDDWDLDMDGEWEPPLVSNPKCAKISGCGPWKAPTIDNPLYKGKWKPPMITNPDYKGKWSPRKIQNPDFFEEKDIYSKLLPIDAIAFELWTISDGINFDNIYIGGDSEVADKLALRTYQLKKDVTDSETDSWWMKLVRYTNENPWMWAVYLIVFAVPLVFFIGYCCVTPGKRSKSSRPKQTVQESDNDKFTGLSGDEPTPMETNEQEQEEDQAEEEDQPEEEVQAEEEEEEVVEEAPAAEDEKPRLRKTRARRE